VADPRLARIIQRCRDLPGQEMFQYLDAAKKRQSVDSDAVNGYLRELTGSDVTAKDFRTWGGTMTAAMELRDMGVAASRRQADRNIIQAIDKVAQRLGNTRSVCRKYYIHPALLEAYLMGRTAPKPPRLKKNARREKPAAALRRDEVLVLQFLQEAI
jgi:DNA topoisomerase-1